MIIVVLSLVVLLIIIGTIKGYYINIDNINPFKNHINIPNELIEVFVGSQLNLNKNSNQQNPLIKNIK